jgi:hypothetical protein
VCGVLSFEEKTIPEELKTKIITEFEDILFVGIEPENRPQFFGWNTMTKAD